MKFKATGTNCLTLQGASVVYDVYCTLARLGVRSRTGNLDVSSYPRFHAELNFGY